MKLDEIDIKILKLLQENGKITNVQLSSEVNLSPAPTLERVRKLESMGFIFSYHALLNPVKLGLQLTVYTEVGFNLGVEGALDSFLEQIRSFPEVTECSHITGEYDLIMKIYAPDISSYQEFIMKKLLSSKFVSKINSKIVLGVVKDSPLLPLGPAGESLKNR